MALPPLLLQTTGSLVAILALAGMAWWLRLGGSRLLTDDDAVRRAANEVDFGFAPVAIARDVKGTAALARDAQGQIMVIRRHGNRFAGRLLGPAARAAVSPHGRIPQLEVDCGEARFGKILIDLPDPHSWADAINALNTAQDA